MKNKTFLGVLLALAFSACGGEAPDETVAQVDSELCNAHRRMNLIEVYERAGGTCGIWPGDTNGSAKNPWYFNLDTQIAFGSYNSPTRCTYLSAGACSTFAGVVLSFSNTAFCQGFPEGWFYLDIFNQYSGAVIHKYGGSCDSTYDAVVTKASY
jgi:hypothetical protein